MAKVQSNIYKFGKNLYYFHGQICVWGGSKPCIFRIKKASNNFGELDVFCCYEATIESYNSLHYSNIRPATDEEKKS